MMTRYPRAIFFRDGKAVGTMSSCLYQGLYKKGEHFDSMHIMHLPSDHYDFIGPINVLGKTKEDIEKEASQYD